MDEDNEINYFPQRIDWQALSGNPNLTIEFVLSHNLATWDWKRIFANPNLNPEIFFDKRYHGNIFGFEDSPGTWHLIEGISRNPNLTLDFIMKYSVMKYSRLELDFHCGVYKCSHHQWPWNWSVIQLNPGIDLRQIHRYPVLYRNWNLFNSSSNPNIDIKFINYKIMIYHYESVIDDGEDYVLDREEFHELASEVWDWSELSRNPSITMDLVSSRPDLPWKFEYLIQNPNLTSTVVMKEIDRLNTYQLIEITVNLKETFIDQLLDLIEGITPPLPLFEELANRFGYISSERREKLCQFVITTICNSKKMNLDYLHRVQTMGYQHWIDWTKLSQNIKITEDELLSNKDLPWDGNTLVSNSSLKPEQMLGKLFYWGNLRSPGPVQ